VLKRLEAEGGIAMCRRCPSTTEDLVHLDKPLNEADFFPGETRKKMPMNAVGTPVRRFTDEEAGICLR
jgi:hypothetical protein